MPVEQPHGCGDDFRFHIHAPYVKRSFYISRQTRRACYVGEEPGRANALDSALLSLMWGALFGTLHATAVCQAEEIDLGELAQQWIATASVVEWLVADLIKRVNGGRFASDNETLSSISAHYGSFQHLLELVEARGIDRSLVNGYDAIFQRAIAAGQLHEDFAALSQFLGKSRIRVGPNKEGGSGAVFQPAAKIYMRGSECR